MKRFAWKYHKWIGLFFLFFILVFSVSGILLNHRKAIASFSVKRSYLPQSYRYDNWNNNAIKGSLAVSSDSIFLYGGSGIWLADSSFETIVPFVNGIKKGVDNKMTSRMVQDAYGEVYVVTTFGLYKLNSARNGWIDLSESIVSQERFCDVEITKDTLVVMTRSSLFYTILPDYTFTKIDIPYPESVSSDLSLFRTLWTLHSGEMFGLFGKIVVDFMGVILIILSFTGLIFTFFPKIMKRLSKRKYSIVGMRKWWRKAVAYHTKVGAFFFYFLVILVLTGTFLRPPLLIAILKFSLPPIPWTALDASNKWHDKLRVIRYDPHAEEWMFYASNGFFRMSGIGSLPQQIVNSPPVSVMGVTTLENISPNEWLVGSFDGLLCWNQESGESYDYRTKMHVPRDVKHGRPNPESAVSGYMSNNAKEVVFNYLEGAEMLTGERTFAPMPKEMKDEGMSLWQFALEAHVGRIYEPFLGPLSGVFVFLSGVLFFVILISGKRIHDRRKPKKKKKRKTDLS